MKILLVDDEVELVGMLVRFLRSSGFDDVGAAYTPEAAVEYIENNQPDLVILDINLNAVMTGMDVLKRVRRTTPGSRVCMVSAYREEYQRESLALGAEWFLRKPARIQDFMDIVHSAQSR